MQRARCVPEPAQPAPDEIVDDRPLSLRPPHRPKSRWGTIPGASMALDEPNCRAAAAASAGVFGPGKDACNVIRHHFDTTVPSHKAVPANRFGT